VNRPTHVAIVDDHSLFREGLATLLAASNRICVVAHGPDVDTVVATPESAAIDVLLLDVETNGPPARTTLSRLQRERPTVAVVMLTMHRDAALRRTLLDAGAVDFLTKDTPTRELIDRIEKAGTTRAGSGTPSMTANREHAILSDRELEVLRLIAADRSNAAIADELHLALGTVKRHVYNIYRKLDVSTRIGATTAARRLSLIE
jgi:DNA-binding NarL/FixJ family response regulator